MYTKDLSEDFRLRLSKTDMDFLRDLSEQRSVSISECVRSIIGEYRRSTETISVLLETLKMSRQKGDGLSYGDTKTDFNNQL